MNSTQLVGTALSFLLFGLPFGLGGCHRDDLTVGPDGWTPATGNHAFEDWVESNPCGSLTIKEPLFNVSGYVLQGEPLGSMVFLFIAPSASRKAGLYVAEKCAPLMAAPTDAGGRFHFESLPEGDYAAVVQQNLVCRGCPVPIIDEYRLLNFSISTAASGQDGQYAVSVFSVRLAQLADK